MAAKLPYSRVVNVTLSRAENFPSRRGFGVPILLTTQTKAGKLDATLRTRAYGSMDEVVVDWAPADAFYKAAEAAFSQNPRPLQIKAGFIVNDGTPTAAELKTQLDALYAYDAAWYWVSIEAGMRDTPQLDGLIEWIQAKNRQAAIDTNDVLHLNPADTTNISARNKNKFDRSWTFYHSDVAEYGAFALAASLGTRNFDNANSAYTAKFKKLKGVDPINVGSAGVQAITGFTPALGQSAAAGHMANTIVDIGDQYFVVEGSTLTQNVFIDEIHATDWIIARTEEETLAIFLNNDRVPFTDVGMALLASGARTVMQIADQAGLIARDLDPETGLYAPAVEFTIPAALSVPASQRKMRVSPAIAIRFRYAGAVHYTTINYTMSF